MVGGGLFARAVRGRGGSGELLCDLAARVDQSIENPKLFLARAPCLQ